MDYLDPELVIHDADRVIAVYGEWPPFGDFEVVQIVFDRHLPVIGEGPHITAYIHMWQISGRSGDGKHLLYDTHQVVGLQFRNVVRYRMEWFNHQNVIDDILIVQAEDDKGATVLDVVLPSQYGAELEVRCRSIHVVSVEAQLPDDSIYTPDDPAA